MATLLSNKRKEKQELEQELKDLKGAIALLSTKKRSLASELQQLQGSETVLELREDTLDEEAFEEFFSTEDTFLEETRDFLLKEEVTISPKRRNIFQKMRK